MAKTVELFRAFDVRMGPRAVRHYRAGKTYPDVLEMHAKEIVAAGAGRIVSDGDEVADGGTTKRRRRQSPAPNRV